jgi:hypothetical protein
MKKLFLSLIGLLMLNFAYAAECTTTGPEGSVTVKCTCSYDEACRKAANAYDAIF